jgi:AraC-like DNA-binding protein
MAIIDSELSNHELSPLFLAQKMKISKSYLYFMFRAVGISVNKMIIERRLEKCRNELENFNLRKTSVTDIAFNAGFRDLSHFCHRFKARYGTSPGKYRVTN